MKILLAWMAALLFPFVMNAQTIQSDVIATSGERLQTANASITFTVGEAVVDNLNAGSAGIGQGFHQVMVPVVETSVETPAWVEDVKIYPNPTSGDLFFVLPQVLIDGRTELVDLNGRVLMGAIISSVKSTWNLSSYPDAPYFIRIFKGEEYAVFKIIKSTK